MNPATDIGKRDLPTGLRSRFTELYVHSPDTDRGDLLAIIDKYIGHISITDAMVVNDVADLYLTAKKLAESTALSTVQIRSHISVFVHFLELLRMLLALLQFTLFADLCMKDFA